MIVISCLLVVLMGVSLIASLGRSGSGASSGASPGGSDSTIDSGGGGSGNEDEKDKPCVHRDANDDNVCDYCEAAYNDGRDTGTFGGTVVQNLTFDENVAFDYSNKGTIEDVVCGIKYGAVTTKDGYLKFYTQESDSQLQHCLQ